MRKVVRDCFGCAEEKGCSGRRCPFYEQTIYVCDRCGDELELGETYKYKGGDYCRGCITDVLIEDQIIETEEC